MHATVGGVGIHGEQGLAFACCTKPATQHGAPPPPLPIHPLSPLQNPAVPPHPPSPSVLAAPLPAYQKVCMAEQWAFYPHETWNVSECSRLGPSLLSEHALCPLFPPRERDRDTESIGGCVNTEGGECGDSESWSAKKVFTKRQVRKRGWAKI